MSQSRLLFSLEKNAEGRRQVIAHDDALHFLRTKLKRRFAILCIAGLYRTGKSTLLNKLLQKHGVQGFKVGGTTNACTKGLWIHEQLLLGKDAEGEYDVLLFDSEGFDSLEVVDPNYDFLLFLLINLFTDLLVFNTMGAINTSTNQRLAMVTQMTKQIANKRIQASGAKADESAEQLSKYFPSLIIVVRDAILALEDENGNIITPNQYLERAWASTPPSNDAGAAATQVDENGIPIPQMDQKAELRKCYSRRCCLRMPQPVNNNKHMAIVDGLNRNQLAPEFNTALDEFEAQVYKSLTPKRVDGIAITGASLVEYIRSALPSINDGSIPLVEDSVLAMSEKQSQGLYDDAMAQWQMNFQVLHQQQQATIGTARLLLFDPDLVDSTIQEGVDKLVKGFHAQSFKNAASAAAEAKLRKELQQKASEIIDTNMRLIRSLVQNEAAKFEAHVNSCQNLDALQSAYETFRTTVCTAVANTTSQRVKDLLDSFLPCGKILQLSSAIYERQSRDMKQTIAKLQEDQTQAETLRNQLQQLQQSSKQQSLDLEQARTGAEELRTRLTSELDQLRELSDKARDETAQTIEQMGKELASASLRAEELNTQLLSQISEHGDVANERERTILEQALLIEQLSKQKETYEADLARATEQIQQLREQVDMLSFYQRKAEQTEMELMQSRADLEQCHAARTGTDEERMSEFSKMREEAYQVMQATQLELQLERQRNADQVSQLETSLLETRTKQQEDTRKQQEVEQTLHLQLAHASEENRKYEQINSDLRDKLATLAKSVQDQNEAHLTKMHQMHAQMREDHLKQNDTTTAQAKQRMDEMLEQSKQISAAKNEAARASGQLEEMKKRLKLLEDGEETHKRLRQEHQTLFENHSRQTGELTMLRTENADNKKRCVTLQAECKTLKADWDELKRKYDIDLFKATMRAGGPVPVATTPAKGWMPPVTGNAMPGQLQQPSAVNPALSALLGRQQ